MASSRALFVLLATVICYSHIIIISTNAVPFTRTKSLVQGNIPQETTKGLIWDAQINHVTKHFTARMDIELNDYPGSGANNRHTPKPQFGRCADC